MRLYKKAAVCLLAAALSLSMLTACGGNNTPDNPADSKPGTSEGGEEKPGGGEEKPGGGEEKPGTGDDGKEDPPKKDPETWEESRTKKYYDLFTSQSLQVDGVGTTLDSAGQAAGDAEKFSLARSGEMYSMTMETTTGSGDPAQEKIILKKDKVYQIVTSESLKYVEIDSTESENGQNMKASVQMMYSLMLPAATPAKPVCGTVEIDGQTYDTETFTGTMAFNGVQFKQDLTYCYDKTNALTYVIEKCVNGSGETIDMRMTYPKLTTVVDSACFAVPTKEDGYTIEDNTAKKDPDPGTGDGEETENKLPKSWEESKTLAYLTKEGVNTNSVSSLVMFKFGSSAEETGGYWARDNKYVLQLQQSGSRTVKWICKYYGKYYAGEQPSGTKADDIVWSIATQQEITTFMKHQKVLMLPSSTDYISNFWCQKGANGTYEEHATVNGVEYVYIIRASGELGGIIVPIDGQLGQVAFLAVGKAPADSNFPEINIK